MKVFLLIFFLPIFSWALDCRLETPIALDHDIVQQGMKLKNIVLSETLKTPNREFYDFETDTLDLDLHSIDFSPRKKAILVATLEVPRTGYRTGFLYNYDFSEKLSSSVQQIEDVLAYHTQELRDDPLEILELFLTIEKDQITSIALTHPVYIIEGDAFYFSGENQTVCLLKVN